MDVGIPVVCALIDLAVPHEDVEDAKGLGGLAPVHIAVVVGHGNRHLLALGQGAQVVVPAAGAVGAQDNLVLPNRGLVLVHIGLYLVDAGHGGGNLAAHHQALIAGGGHVQHHFHAGLGGVGGGGKLLGEEVDILRVQLALLVDVIDRDGLAVLGGSGDGQVGVAVDGLALGGKAHRLGAVVVGGGNQNTISDHQAVGDAIAGVVGVAVDGEHHLGAVLLRLGDQVGHNVAAHHVGAIAEQRLHLRGLGVVCNGVALLEAVLILADDVLQRDAVVDIPAPVHGHLPQTGGLGVLCIFRSLRAR